jgi:hypothetical protein
MSRYAKKTLVTPDRSRAEVEQTLVRYGASGFAYSWERREEPYPHPADCPICHGTREHEPRKTYGPNAMAGTARCPRLGNGPATITRESVLIGFKMRTPRGERRVQLEIPMPHEVESGSKARTEAATRQRWRSLVLVLKAKLEAVESGISTLEAEFLANVVMPNGQTIGQSILPRLSEAVQSGRLLPESTEGGR